MNARTVLVVAAACAALVGTASAADPLRDPWAGLLPGSFVHQRTTTKTSVANRADRTTESRTTLLEASKGAVTLKSEFRVADGAWQEQRITIDPAAAGAADAGRPEPLGEETLVVDGRSLACRKQRTVVDGTTTVSWHHPDYGVVRSESSTAGGATTRVALEKIGVKVHVGNEDVECRQVEARTTTSVGTSTTTTWVSAAVPGGVVRSESLTKQGDVSVTMVTETLEFAARRRD